MPVVRLLPCFTCKRTHYTHYKCSEGGWEDEEGLWHIRPLNAPLPAKQKPVSIQKPINIQKPVSIAAKQTGAAKHRNASTWTAGQALQQGKRGDEARRESLKDNPTLKQKIARQGAEEKWRRWREAHGR